MATDLHAIGREAFSSLERHGIEPTPENYLVWYTHHAAENPALSRIIRILEESGDSFDEERCRELYQRFFVHSDAQKFLHEATERISGLTEALERSLSATARETDQAEQRLGAICAALDRPAERDRLIELGRMLRKESERLAAGARTLGEQVRYTSEEMRSLRVVLERVRREAETDALTGLANRKAFDHKLRKLAIQAMESGRPLSLFVTDIDHFKRFNDTYGHQMGDVVLKLVAQRLRHHLRPEDVAARYGGEEFVVLLPDTALAPAAAIAERIRRDISTHRLRERGDGRDLGRVTISAGVAEFRPGEPLKAFFERADQALYAAKRRGRNWVVREDELEDHPGLQRAAAPPPA